MPKPRLIITEPAWQNFSSMYREAEAVEDAKTGMEASHHLTATLYFGISALEAFLNQRMRLHLAGTPEEDIVEKLRKPTLVTKLKKWPKEILGAPITLRRETLGKLIHYNDVRGALTHPKHADHRDYIALEVLDPKEVIDSIAEYISQFLFAADEQFHYWLWGWNYISPGREGHQIALLPESQVVFSMNALGFPRTPGFPMASSHNGSWRSAHMRGYSAYAHVARFLESRDQCEPKHPQFPYQPKLCRRWWDPEHHTTCGHASQQAIQYAIDYNPFEERRISAAAARFQQMSRLQRVWQVIKFFFGRQ